MNEEKELPSCDHHEMLECPECEEENKDFASRIVESMKKPHVKKALENLAEYDRTGELPKGVKDFQEEIKNHPAFKKGQQDVLNWETNKNIDLEVEQAIENSREEI